MKVVTVSTSKHGGAGIAAYRLHKNLLKNKSIESFFLMPFEDGDKGENVTTLTRKTKTIFEKILNKIGILNKKDKSYKYIKSCNLKCEIATLPYSNFKVEDNNLIQEADIINIHWIANFIDYESFFRKIKKPIVWTLHDMNAFQGLFHYEEDSIRNLDLIGEFDDKILNDKIKYIHQHDNIHVVCLSKWFMEKSQKSKILGRYPHYLIPNGIDFKNYNFTFDKNLYKQNLGFVNNCKTLLFIAQDINNYRKGFDLLLNALENTNDIAFNFITVGGEKIMLPNNFNHIHFSKIIDSNELNKIYNISDLLILPSREDNLPNVMLESFANGTPVLSFNTGGMKDYIIHGKNGILISYFDPNLISEEIINFHKNMYNFDSQYIKDFAFDNFNDLKQVNSYLKLFKNIV